MLIQPPLPGHYSGDIARIEHQPFKLVIQPPLPGHYSGDIAVLAIALIAG